MESATGDVVMGTLMVFQQIFVGPTDPLGQHFPNQQWLVSITILLCHHQQATVEATPPTPRSQSRLLSLALLIPITDLSGNGSLGIYGEQQEPPRWTCGFFFRHKTVRGVLPTLFQPPCLWLPTHSMELFPSVGLGVEGVPSGQVHQITEPRRVNTACQFDSGRRFLSFLSSETFMSQRLQKLDIYMEIWLVRADIFAISVTGGFGLLSDLGTVLFTMHEQASSSPLSNFPR